jgi:hypothetical protein
LLRKHKKSKIGLEKKMLVNSLKEKVRNQGSKGIDNGGKYW